MLNHNETILWRRLERLEEKVLELEQYIRDLELEKFQKRKHYGGR